MIRSDNRWGADPACTMMELMQPATNTIVHWLVHSCKSRLNVRVNTSINAAAYFPPLSMIPCQCGYSLHIATACQL
jgi:hypothetical protein